MRKKVDFKKYHKLHNRLLKRILKKRYIVIDSLYNIWDRVPGYFNRVPIFTDEKQWLLVNDIKKLEGIIKKIISLEKNIHNFFKIHYSKFYDRDKQCIGVVYAIRVTDELDFSLITDKIIKKCLKYNVYIIKSVFVDGDPYDKENICIRYFYDYIRCKYYCDYVCSWTWPPDDDEEVTYIDWWGDALYAYRCIEEISEESLKPEQRKEFWEKVYPYKKFN